MPDTDTPSKALSLPAPVLAIAGWVLPGLAHALIGQRKRGTIVGATVLLLFIGGLFIGGIDVVDSRNDKLWYAGQLLAGPVAIATDQIHKYLDLQHGAAIGSTQPVRPDADDDFDEPGRKYDTSIGRMNELGTLYCALAGVLNLLVILDAIGRDDSEDDDAPAAAGGANA